MRHSFAPSSDREPNLVGGAPNCCGGHSPASRGPPWTHLARRLPWPGAPGTPCRRRVIAALRSVSVIKVPRYCSSKAAFIFYRPVCEREGVFNKVHKSTPRKSRRITELRIMPHFDGLIPKFNPQAQRFRTKGLRFVGEQVRLSQYQGLFV